jgi:6-phosphogluconolactonase
MSEQVTRRKFLAGAAALPWAVRAMAQPKKTTPPRWVLLGTDKGKGLYRASWNPATGEIGKPELALELHRPSFFAAHPKLPVLYSANEGGGLEATVSALAVNAKHGTVKVLGTAPTRGDGPCYVAINGDGSLLLVADYAGGAVAAIPLDEYGAPGIPAPGVPLVAGGTKYEPPIRYARSVPEENALDCHKIEVCGPLGPVKDRQDAPHLHCAVFAPKDDYALVCDLGDDAILVFGPGLASTSDLGMPKRVAARPGSGPRHLAFHPNGKWVYCINELDCTMEIYDWQTGEGGASLTRRDGSAVSTLPPGATLTGNTGCEIAVGDDGRFLYTCTRGSGSNTITVYAVDAAAGTLTAQQTVSCGGSVPRYIGFDPSRRWLLCANQASSTVTVFAHDAATGRLSEKPKTFAAETPLCVAFA